MHRMQSRPDVQNPVNQMPVDDGATVSSQDVPDFPILKEKAPPIPPPVQENSPLTQELRPPLPPPVAPELWDATSSPTVELPQGTGSARRKFPRRKLAFVTALLILVCFGLVSDEPAGQPELLNTTPVVFSEPATSLPPSDAAVDLGKYEEGPEEYVVEELENPGRSETNNPLVEPARSTQGETVQLVRAEVALPKPSPAGREALKASEPLVKMPVAPSDDLDLSKDGEPAICQLELAPKRLLGTAIEWAETANEAAMIADDKDKLVYLIQVSGNFEIPEFT